MQPFTQFDEFRYALSTRLNAEVVMYGADGDDIRSLRRGRNVFSEEERKQVWFSLVRTDDDLVAFNFPDARDRVHDAFLFVPLEPGNFCYNSVVLDEHHIGVSTRASGAPFAIRAPAGCTWVVVHFSSRSTHLNLMSSTTMPVKMTSNRLELFRDALDNYLQGVVSPGTPVLDQVNLLLAELETTSLPMRPQKTTGRSRLSRKHIVAAMLKVIRGQTGSSPIVKPLAHDLGITPHSLINMFKEVMGLSPKQYWLLRKLYLFRDALLSEHYRTVTDAAFSLDISDMGRMSARYRAVFGENPSETLKQRMAPEC